MHPVPLTEAERVPSAAENVEVQVIAHELEREARRSGATCSTGAGWSGSAPTWRSTGSGSATARCECLRDDGVDITDPARVLLAHAAARHGRPRAALST